MCIYMQLGKMCSIQQKYSKSSGIDKPVSEPYHITIY